MYSSYKLNKQGDNIQSWCTAFPIWNQSVVPCPFLTVVSWPAYRFLRRQVRCSGIPISKNFPQLVVIHTVKGFGVVSKAEMDVFLKLSCFFSDPADVGNLISGSSAFSKPSLYIWNFSVYVLLKPSLNSFEHNLANVLLLLFSHLVMSDSATSWTVVHQAPLFIGFPKQEYWSGLPFSSPRDLPDPGIKPRSPTL